MSAPSVELRPAVAADLPAVRQLLVACGLPVADLTAALLEGFVVAVRGGAVLGVAGLEPAGRDALLRSVAVRAEQRGTGLGTRLVDACLTGARDQHMRALFLIPNDATAEAFFTHLGFGAIDRGQVPAAVRALPEFGHLCPQTHPCLCLALGGD